MKPEVWLRGPIEGVDPQLMPIAHALLQAREDLEREVPDLTPRELWLRPGGAASPGFHVQHISGSMDRLLTYALGRPLSTAQREALAHEADPGDPPTDAKTLLAGVVRTIHDTLEAIRAVSGDDLRTERFVGRARLPSTTGGLLFHLAEHTTRHVGQFITTKRIVRGLGLTEES